MYPQEKHTVYIESITDQTSMTYLLLGVELLLFVSLIYWLGEK